MGRKIWIFLMLLGFAVQTKAQVVPDFKGYFAQVFESRAEFNRYSDSLFLVKNKGQWIELVKRRFRKTQQLYAMNEKRRQELTDACLHYQGDIPVKAFGDLFDFYHTQVYAHRELDNPLTLAAVSKVFDYGGERVVDSLKCINVLKTWKLYANVKLWNLGGNVDYLKQAYECGKFILSDEAKSYPYHDYALSYALQYMPKTMWVVHHIGTVKEYRDYCHKLDEFLARPNVRELVSADVYAKLCKIQQTADETLVRNTYLVGDTVMGKQEADSLMKVIIKRNLSSPNTSCLSRIRTLYMQMQMGMITANEAREDALRRYRINWEQIKNKRLSTTELDAYLQPFYTFFFLNYKATVPFEEKRRTVVGMVHDIERVYKNRLNHEGTTDYVRDMLRITTYDKVTMYLTPEEVGDFLRTMNVASQAITYAHSQVTSDIAEYMMKDVLKFKPELLVGQLGCNTIDEVRKKGKEFIRFIKSAALYHDIGMNSVASVTKNEFRPMYDIEREIYERHTEYGLQYLTLTPELLKFKDITLGHHKWYNGKGGFPANFDNTQSPMRILIDMVSLSDAVLRISRQMANTQADSDVSSAVLGVLKIGAGTRFNPELVNLLLTQSDIANKVRSFSETEWANKLYEVFRKNYFDRED